MNRFVVLILTDTRMLVSPRQYEDLFFRKQISQWFSNSGLGCEEVRTSQKLDLVIRVEKNFRTTELG